MYEIHAKDENHNVITGNVLTYDSQHCIIRTPSSKLVVIQGLHNFIVAEHDNALMICPKDQEQEVKKFVEAATQLDVRFS
jgi:mannose-1-phosphate guanylyltransferase